MIKATTKTISMVDEHRKSIAYALLVSCAFLAVLYVMNVYSVVSRTVALQKSALEIASVSKRVEALDSKYLALSSKITPDALGAYGYSEGKVAAYISRSSSLGRMAFGGHEL